MQGNGITNSFVLCDCCLHMAVYYQNAGNYKQHKRCARHLPSWVLKSHHDSIGNNEGKHWVHCSKGVSVAHKNKVDNKL